MTFASTLREGAAVAWGVMVARTRIILRYKGWLAMDIAMPILITLIPILMGRAAAGDQAAEAFAENTGTGEYVAYLLIGANVFMVVSMFLWHIGMWIRRERMLGTLESIYLTSAHRFPVLVGTTLYGAIRTMFTFSISFSIGCLIFGINPFQGDILIAIGFLAVGMIPLFGMSLIFGAVIFKVKEAGALMNLAQWGVSLLMGLFFPVAILPPFLRACAYAFPPTWMTNGVRASLLGVSYFLSDWYLDFAVIWLFILVFPLLGWYFFMMTDRGMRESEGVGQF